VEWLGQVPAHWEVRRFQRCVDVKEGQVDPESDEFSLLPLIAPNHVESGTGLLKILESAADQGAESGKYLCRAGDVVYSKIRPALRKVCIAPVRCLCSADMYPLSGHSGLTNDFLYWSLLSEHSSALAALESQRVAMPKINRESLKGLSVMLPPLAEQQAVAAFLRSETAKIDALVAEQRRLMDLLTEKRQAVISQAVTKGLNPDAPTKPSGVEWLGDVPAHWGVTRLANVFREAVENGYDDLPILSVSIHHGVSDKEMDDEELDRKVTRSEDRTKYRRVRPGDLVYNMMRAWQGGFGTVAVDGMVSPAYVVARPRVPIATEYIEHLLRTPQAVEQMRRYSRGITDFRLRLYWDEFRNITVAIPPFSEASEICNQIASMDGTFSSLTSAAEDAIELLSARRTALISAAVTGQIDVRGLATAEAA
jgi:type I restriction enzyme S subunit